MAAKEKDEGSNLDSTMAMTMMKITMTMMMTMTMTMIIHIPFWGLFKLQIV
jgi:hypothetical protein